MDADAVREGAASGGRQAELYRLHMPEAVRLALLLSGSRHEAEDMAQDAFVRTAGRFADLRSRDAFPAYLRRSVLNESRARARRRGVVRKHAAATYKPTVSADGAETLADRDRLRRALFTLPERQRAALVLRFYCDLSESETADALHCRPGTVKSLVARGTERMREALGGDR